MTTHTYTNLSENKSQPYILYFNTALLVSLYIKLAKGMNIEKFNYSSRNDFGGNSSCST